MTAAVLSFSKGSRRDSIQWFSELFLSSSPRPDPCILCGACSEPQGPPAIAIAAANRPWMWICPSPRRRKGATGDAVLCSSVADEAFSHQVILTENSSPQNMLTSLFHVNYLYWLERHAGFESRGTLSDCRPRGRLQMSLEFVEREFDHAKKDGELAGWIIDSLIPRPSPNRIRPGYVAPAFTS